MWAAMFATAFRRLARAPSHLYGSMLAGGVVLGAALSARPADAEKNVRRVAARLPQPSLPLVPTHLRVCVPA